MMKTSCPSIKISVVLPCYNVQDYIRVCLDIIVNQTLKDIEIICVDDKSTDHTLQILQKYAKTDNRIKVIALEKNSGAGHARNTGLKLAKGEYVSFIDPDDYIDLDFYEKLYKIAVTNNYDVVKGGMISHDMLTNTTNVSTLNDRIQENNIHFCSEHVTAIYKKDFLIHNNLFYPEDVITGQDSVFLSILTTKHPHIGISNDTHYHYLYNRPNSLDSETLSHIKTIARITKLNYKKNILSGATFNSLSDKTLFIQTHILDNFMYTFNKKFVDNADKKLLFDWLVNANFPRQDLNQYFGQYKANAILKKNYKKFISPEYKMHIFYKERCPNGRRHIYLFGIKILSYKKGKKKENKPAVYKPKHINYKSYNDLALDIKSNLQKIPLDIDLIIGIPRSGMIPAYIIGLALNKKVCSVAEFTNGILGNKGFTKRVEEKEIRNILVVDDTVDTGLSMQKTKEALSSFTNKFNFIYLAIYANDNTACDKVDFFLKQLPKPRFFQWNYMCHRILQNACFDMDGVLCVDPTEEENDDGDKYIHFIKNAKQLYIPSRPIGYIVTSRLEKYRKETEKWLKQHNIKYKKLYMLNATAEERKKLKMHATFKAHIYKNLKDSTLFIESAPWQAQQIAELSGKKCICCENDEIYGENK